MRSIINQAAIRKLLKEGKAKQVQDALEKSQMVENPPVPIPKFIPFSDEDVKGTPLQGLGVDVGVTVAEYDIENMPKPTLDLQVAIDRDRVNNSSIIGANNNDGKEFGGWVKTCGNTDGEVGVATLTGDFGVRGGSKPDATVVCSGAPIAIKAAQLKHIDNANKAREDVAKHLDTLPPILGAPAAGFLGTVLKIVGIAGSLGAIFPAVTPMGGVIGKIKEIRNHILEATGIQGIIDGVKGAYEDMVIQVDGVVEDITTSVNETFDEMMGGLEQTGKDVANQVSDGVNNAISEGALNVSQSVQIYDPAATAETSQAIRDLNPQTVIQNLGGDNLLVSPFTGRVLSAEASAEILSFRTTVVQGAPQRVTLGGLLRELAEETLNVLKLEVKRLTTFNIPDDAVNNIVNDIVEGGVKRAKAVANITLLDSGITPLLNKFENILDEADGILSGNLTEEEILNKIKEAGEAGGATAAQIKEVQDAYRKKFLEVENSSAFNDNLEEIFEESNETTRNTIEPKIKTKFSYVGSVEELEREFYLSVMRSARPIKDVVIHATDTFTNKNIGAEEIEDSNSDGGEIGYHYVIRRDGRLQRGRAVSEKGNHADYGFDVTSIGIVMVGGINRASTESLEFSNSSASFTRAQYDTLEQFLKVFYNHIPGGNVFGHNELHTLFSDEGGADEEDYMLDPYFDVAEYILSLFGKVNSAQLESAEFDSNEESVVTGHFLVQSVSAESNTSLSVTNITTIDENGEVVQEEESFLDVISRQETEIPRARRTPAGDFSSRLAREAEDARIAEENTENLPLLSQPPVENSPIPGSVKHPGAVILDWFSRLTPASKAIRRYNRIQRQAGIDAENFETNRNSSEDVPVENLIPDIDEVADEAAAINERPPKSQYKVIYAEQTGTDDARSVIKKGDLVDPALFKDEGMAIPKDLTILANLIESDITVSSGFRDEVYNALIGGAKYSRHLRGIAVDIQIDKFASKNGGTGNSKFGTNYYHTAEAHSVIYPLVKKAVEDLGYGGVHLYGYFIHLDKGPLQCGQGGGVLPGNHGNRALGAFMRRRGFTSTNLTQKDSLYDEMGNYLGPKTTPIPRLKP